MVVKKLLCFYFIYLFSIYAYSIETNNYDFHTENINPNTLNTIEVLLPDMSSKGGEIREDRYTIKIGNDGIIRSIVLMIGDDNSRFLNVFRRNNSLNIISYEQRPFINNIEWDNNIYVRGLAGTFFLQDGSFTRVNVSPNANVIYEAPIIELLKTTSNSIKEINRLGGMAVAYSDNITTVSFSNNLFSKVLYKLTKEEIIGVYYGGPDGEDEYTPPIKIINKSNIKLHSKEYVINIINYFILQSFSSSVRNILFPLLFLENPFSSNNWDYSSTSQLKEKNNDYSPSNLSSPEGLPWASANGYGIGDKITINMGTSPNDSIIVFNGFASKERPDLYDANSRARQIKITNLNNGKSKIRTIEDSMEPQNIGIRDLDPAQNTSLEIEILSVYQGSRFRDLCIQAIL